MHIIEKTNAKILKTLCLISMFKNNFAPQIKKNSGKIIDERDVSIIT